MKKTVSFVFAFCMIFMCGALVACQQQTTYSVVKGAFDKIETMDAISAEMEMEIKMSTQGVSISIPMTMEIKGRDGEPPVAYMHMEASFMGQSLDFEHYREGEWEYSVANGVGTKSKVDANQEDSEDNEFLPAPSEEMLEGIELVRKEDGTQEVSFDLSGDQVPDLVMSFFEGMGSSGFDMDEDAITGKATITIKDGHLSVYEMVLATTMDLEGQSFDTEISCVFELDKPGTQFTITPPEGYQNFPEASDSGAGV